jgi:hypothetical protein
MIRDQREGQSIEHTLQCFALQFADYTSLHEAFSTLRPVALFVYRSATEQTMGQPHGVRRRLQHSAAPVRVLETTAFATAAYSNTPSSVATGKW